MIAQLKLAWKNAKYTPPAPEDDESYEESEAHEMERLRAIVEAFEFPPIEAFAHLFLNAYWGKADCGWILAFPPNAERVYGAVARIFYAMCTDAHEETISAIGKELHEAGGMALMLCTYYGSVLWHRGEMASQW